jgi:hypothetical protein
MCHPTRLLLLYEVGYRPLSWVSQFLKVLLFDFIQKFLVIQKKKNRSIQYRFVVIELSVDRLP